jgi:glycosyltransferase involved in cell wall biosynthesis
MIGLLIMFTLVHLLFYLFLFAQLVNEKGVIESAKETKLISIVVCFKDEEKNVDTILKTLLLQKSDDIVLVDDFSADQTFEKLSRYKSERIQIIRASIDLSGKKQAVNDGIASAKHDRILLTDADCIPATSDWSIIMNSVEKPIVLGYSPMKKTKGLVNLFARFETYLTGVQYLSYAKVGLPYMGVGRNMIIDRYLRASNLDNVKGQNLASGDDDLTINAIATKENTGICIHPDSFVLTDSPVTLKGFISQKTRHVTTSVHYKFVHQIMLGAFSASQILFYLLLFLGAVIGTIPIQICLIAYIVKQVIQILIHTRLIKKMKESITIHQLLFLDLLLFLYYLVMPFILLIRKNDNRWS